MSRSSFPGLAAGFLQASARCVSECEIGSMKPKLWFAVILVCFLIAALCCPTEAQVRGPSDAWILDVKCKAELTSNGVSKPLTIANVGLGLQAGDKIRCLGQGHLLLQSADGDKTITLSDHWFTIDAIPQNPRYPEIAAALKRYGQPGAGRSADIPATIVWPTMDSVVTPKNFVIRWLSLQNRIRFTIETQGTHRVVWGPTETDGSTGEWVPAGARLALSSYKSQGPDENLLLTLVTSDGHATGESRFSLLDQKDEKSLQASLGFWDEYHNRLASLLGRSYVFSRYRLYEEAAGEYEAALDEAPGSRYLLEEAIRADYRAGRLSRIEKLQQQLLALPKSD